MEQEQRTVSWLCGGMAGMWGGLVGGAIGGASVMALPFAILTFIARTASSPSPNSTVDYAWISVSVAAALGGVGGTAVGLIAGAIVRRPLVSRAAWAKAYGAASIGAIAIALIVMRWVFDQPPSSLGRDVPYLLIAVTTLLIATLPATWATLAIFNGVLDRWLRPRMPDVRAPLRWPEASALGAGIGAIPGGLLSLAWVPPFLGAVGDWRFFAGQILIGGIIVGGLGGGLWGAYRARRS